MSHKQLLLLLIGLHSVIAMTGENPRSNQTEADTWINNTLYSASIENCMKVDGFGKKLSTGHESSSTVAVLKRVHTPTKIVSYFYCTGSLIHVQVVLTVAHCFANTSTDNLVVLAGATLNETLHPDEQNQSREIDSIVIHENYTSDSFGNDIALIFLKEPFAEKNLIGTICLGSGWSTRSTTDLNCIVTSWNLNDRNVNGLPRLTTTKRTIVRNEKCETVLQVTGLGEEFEMAKDNICLGGGIHKNDMWGNGGAPLFCQICGRNQLFVQIGILSIGFEANALPDVLTSVVSHRKWIRSSSLKRQFKIHTCINKKKAGKF